MLSKSNNYLLYSFVWLLVSIIFGYTVNNESTSMHNVFVIFNTFSYLLCLYHWYICGCRMISIYVIFVAYTFFSNMGQSFLSLLAVPDELLPLYTKCSNYSIVKMLIFQNACIAAFNFGTVLYINKRDRCVNLLRMQEFFVLQKRRKHNLVPLIDTILFGSLSYILIVSVRMLVMRQNMDYSTFFVLGRGTGNGILMMFVNFCAPLLSFWSIFNRRHIKLIFSVFTLFIIIAMIAGARGLTITYLSLLLICVPVVYPRLFKRKYVWLWVVIGIFFFSSLSFISITRQSAIGASNISYENKLNYYFLATMSEMGTAEIAASYTIDAVDNGFPLYQTIFASIIKAFIPFSSNLSFIIDNSFNLSAWITDYSKSFSGLGFSCIGELYLNFRFLGFIFFGFVGIFFAYAENVAYRNIMHNNNKLYAICLLVILCTLIPWSRGEFSRVYGVVRYCVYLLLVTNLIYKK